MKTLKDQINEALKINNNLTTDSRQPKTRDELREIIKARISTEGPNCDLNDIDVSLITDMTGLFMGSKFIGDISKWDVSNVKNMSWMFDESWFNGDISNWDVSNVTNMWCMFNKSKFNQDISKWDVSNVEFMGYMFQSSQFNQPLKDWDVSNAYIMGNMFAYSKFNQDISNWKINKDCDCRYMFKRSLIKDEYKPILPKFNEEAFLKRYGHEPGPLF